MQFEAIAALLRKEFGLSLFGFDCIIPVLSSEEASGENANVKADTGRDGVSASSNIVIIDVNFFPSYKEVEDFPEKLRSYLRSRGGLK